MPYKIYLPGSAGLSAEQLTKRGLSGLVRNDDDAPQSEELKGISGPDGGHGQFFYWKCGNKIVDPPLGMPDNWKWIEAPPQPKLKLERGAYWIGYNPELEIGPAHLKRRKQLKGHEVAVKTGHKYVIPSAAYLPHHLGIDYDTGKRIPKIDPEFMPYCLRSLNHAASFFSREDEIALLARHYTHKDLNKGEIADLLESPAIEATTKDALGKEAKDANPQDFELSIALEDAIDQAIDALSLNYRLNDILIDILELLDKATVVQICLAALDFPAIEFSRKKKDEEEKISLLTGLHT